MILRWIETSVIVILYTVSLVQASYSPAKLRSDQKIIAAFLARAQDGYQNSENNNSQVVQQTNFTPTLQFTDFNVPSDAFKSRRVSNKNRSEEITVTDLDPKTMPEKQMCRRTSDLTAMGE